ncbi:MAG TPA: DNA-processing protein DprA [Candidatus Dormibacteraeota bacterium]
MSHDAARCIERGGVGWPPRLEDLARPPERVWLRGAVDPAHPAVAVVGARRCSEVAIRVTEWLTRTLGAAGVQVISGLALGIDGAAHRGALAGGGSSVAVLGCGVDVCYPRQHRPLRDALLARGSVLTEEPPGQQPQPWLFPKRNRLIAALCVAVVVVEASERSGALSTARHAADLGREVLAVPGTISSEITLGSNRLIQDGATPILEAADVFAAVPALAGRALPAGVPGSTTRPPRPAPTTAAGRVLDLAAGGAVHPDELALRLALDPARLARLITELELGGHLVSTASGRVQAVTASWSGR